MEDLVKTLVGAPANAVLLLAGIAFLAVGVFGRIAERLDPGPKGRVVAGGLGALLIAISLFLSASENRRETVQAPSAAPASTTAPAAGGAPSTSAPANAPTQSAPPPAPTVAAAPPDDGYPTTLAAGQVAKGEERTYTIDKIALDRHGIDGRALAITVRMQNDTDYPANFWNDGFRLMVDGALTAPTGDLNELVEAHATKEGIVSFVLPGGAKEVSLQIDRFGADAPAIPIALPAAP